MTGSRRYPVLDLSAFLVGSWSLHRTILSPEGQRWGEFTGSASFTPAGEVLTYGEWGTLRLGGYQGSAFRQLRYQLTGPGQAAVYFDYGDFFHELDLREGHCDTTHPCRDDLYRGEFEVLDADTWWQCWEVFGPTKNHTLRTEFRRGDSGGRGM
ncbi:hypothetical protein SAMN04487904_10150 [Actinopolyspora lacussalsi subsp. righensis]|uniref:DUF6314 domain-containing protein n=1 Tax=Actinopolyspora righensis TaxID=995060 RepID=A0A1I6X2G4_9ACTN|nr:hypothetical protein SAMN04487904_10150 [Actinopolyspora righensis]